MANFFKDWISFFKPLRIRNVRIFWAGQSCSLIGMWLQVTAMGILAYSYSGGSGAAVGILSALNAAPFLLGGMYLGSLGDRFDRKKLLLVVQLMQIAVAILLCLLSLMGTLELWHLYVAGLMMGLAQSTAFPVLQAFIADLVPRDLLLEGVGMYSLVFNLCRSLGPPLGGLVLVYGGATLAFGGNAVCCLPLLGVLISLKGYRHSGVAIASRHAQAKESGLKAVLGDKHLLLVMVSALVQNVFGQALYQIVPAITYGDPQSTGLILGSIGAGAVVSILCVLPFIRSSARVGLKLSLGTLWMGGVIGCAGVFPFLHIQQVCFFLAGLATSALFVMTSSTVQLLAAPRQKTAILGLFTTVSVGAQPLAALGWGSMIDSCGVPTTIIFVGSVEVVLSACLLSIPFWRNWRMVL
ncbi:MAG: MFS transporter [Akkermansia sp.]